MKEIVIACGSGIATSTAVAAKIAELLDSNGFNGQYAFLTGMGKAAVEQQIVDFMKE